MPTHYYPDLVHEFFANIEYKARHDGEMVESWVRGRRIILSRERLAAILGCSDQDQAVDLKKGFVTPNRRWDPSHAMNKFDLEYQPFRSSRKEIMLTSVFKPRHRLIIYMMAHNVIPKKKEHMKVRKSDLYFLDYMFIIETLPMLKFPCRISSLAISGLWRGGGRLRSNCHFLVYFP